ncbi:MAG TPA: hypothetical protein VFD77_04465 [Brumimicrobium sp.]|nr:hypothetical protein [Brumimicrobium sp.]
MKKIKTLFGLALLGSLFLSSCSVDDTPSDQDPVSECDGFAKNLLTLSTPFSSTPTSEINYISYSINNLNSSLPNFHGNFTSSVDLNYELPTSTSFYNESSNLHGIVISRAGKYISFNTNTNVAQEFTVPNYITAPISLNNTTYIIEVSNGGYANNGMGSHYDIKTFDTNTGATGTTLPIDPMTKDFDNNSFFHVETLTSATNKLNELYFLSGTNLVTVNTTNNTASHVDLYPNFSSSDYVRFFGLEYSESLGLLAIMHKVDQMTKALVKIDPATGNYTNLLTISNDINSEFYSTTFRECDLTYYLTSLNQASNAAETLYFEFDLNTNTVSHSEILPKYIYGIEFLP